MDNTSLKPILAELKNTEFAIIDGDHSNTRTMIYFAAFSRYYYYGGKVDYKSRILKSGIFNTQNFRTDRAKASYLDIAGLYIFGGQVKLRVSKSLHDTKADLFGVGVDNIDKAITKIRKFVTTNGVDVHYNKNTNVLTTLNITTRQSVSRKLDNWSSCYELENLITNRIVEVYGHEYKYLENNYYKFVGSFTRDNG